MKKLLVLLLGIILGILICHYFINPNTDTESMTKPRGIISPKTAKQMDEAYNARHKLISDSILGKPDNRSAWWSLTDLKNYITYAESQAKDLGYVMDGIRVYQAAHPNELNDGFTTVFMAPTGFKSKDEDGMVDGGNPEDGDGGSGDIPGGDPLNMGTGGNPPNANYPQGNNN